MTTPLKLTTEEKRLYAAAFVRVAACGFIATVEPAHLSGKYDKAAHAGLYKKAIAELAEDNPDVLAKLLTDVVPFAYFHTGVFTDGKTLNELVDAKLKAAPAASSGYADAISEATVVRTPFSKLQQLINIGCSNVDFAKKYKTALPSAAPPPAAPTPTTAPLTAASDDKTLRYVFYGIVALGLLLIGTVALIFFRSAPSAAPPALAPPAPAPAATDLMV